jgi:hypothetical protein
VQIYIFGVLGWICPVLDQDDAADLMIVSVLYKKIGGNYRFCSESISTEIISV